MYFDPKDSQKSLPESGPAWVAFMILQNREKVPDHGKPFSKISGVPFIMCNYGLSISQLGNFSQSWDRTVGEGVGELVS